MKFPYVVLAVFVSGCSNHSSPPKTVAAPTTVVADAAPSVPLVRPAVDDLPPPKCPSDMTHVSGIYCTEVIQNCIKYLDPAGSKFARCAEFSKSVCTGKKMHMDFCIDTEEHHPPDSNVPSSDMTFDIAAQECVQEGKKLCDEDQWTFACEGEEMLPHTTGYTRPSDKCNFDKTHLTVDGKFVSQALPIDQNLQCVSPFGVHNMNGNVDEWVVTKHPFTPKNTKIELWSGLKGGWWGGLRNRCRPITLGHGLSYHDVQIGYRCCEGTNE